MTHLAPFAAAIARLCATHKVKSLFAFGSVLTDRFSAGSDVDLLVNFVGVELEEYADNYFDLKFSLQDLLQHPVDLLEEQALTNPYFRQAVNEGKQLIYGQ